jgi:UMF1 family MFS transporter
MQNGTRPLSKPVRRPTRRLALLAWCLFDWANSPMPTVVITFVFAAYFARGIVGNQVEGTALWSWGLAVSALLIALSAPILGAIADAGGRRKPWIFWLSALTVIAAALLWFAAPDPSWTLYALVMVVLVNLGFELGMVFYNAMLPDLASADRVGRISGWAWSVGYFGGLACLLLVLVGLIQADPPPFGLSEKHAEDVRAAMPLLSIWYIVFGWPMFLFTPDRRPAGLSKREAVRQGLRRLRSTIANLRPHKTIIRFLLARLFYIDGLNTLFGLGGVYAATAFDMNEAEVIKFAIALNVTAGLGAMGFAWIDDLLGAKFTINVSIAALILLGTGILLVHDVTWFWVLGMAIGIFIGPTQSASRSLMARLAPPEMTGEMFGLFALSGRVTAFVGPLLVGTVATVAGSQRVGMGVIILLFVIGFVLMLPVEEPARYDPRHRSTSAGSR